MGQSSETLIVNQQVIQSIPEKQDKFCTKKVSPKT